MKRTNRLARARPAQARAGREPAPEAGLEIVEIGGRGDGVAAGPAGPVYAPLTLPGERIRARLVGDRAELVAVEQPSASRQSAPCALFGQCGGCQLQHWQEAPYLAWKTEQVRRALARRGLEAPIDPIVAAWGNGRRRAAFHASRVGGTLRFGFIARGGARITDLEACPVLEPQLAEAMPVLRKLAQVLTPPRGEATLHCLLTDVGVDCDIKGAVAPDRAQAERAAAIAAPLARLTLDGAPLAARAQPFVMMGVARVYPPPGAFLQASALAEALLAARALEAIAGAKRIVDLFSGIGTFALRAAALTETHAIDSESAMLTALKAAADAAQLPVTILRRDLLRTPLSALEMKRYDAVMFDPPRAGARLQASEIAKSRVTRVAAISCDAGTFARDARVLADGGFRLTRVTPVDQFRWTPHVELVGAFER